MKQAVHADFLLGLLLNPEDAVDMFLRNVIYFKWTKRRYVSEDTALHNRRCENLKSSNNNFPTQLSDWSF
jgi:hypothetical protein